MRPWVAVVLLGIAAGAAHAQRDGELAPLAGEASVAQRAAFYERVAGVRSTAVFDELASQVAESPPGDLRRFQLDAIVERYLELDAAKAVRLSGDLLRADAPDLVRRVYERLGRANVNAALAALSETDDPTEARIAADALLGALGNDLRALDLVTAALHGVDREQFRMNGLVRLGAARPRQALAAALELRDPVARRSTAASIMGNWVASAPNEAIVALQGIDDPELRAALRNVMLGNLRDADSILAFLDTLDDAERQEAISSGALSWLAQLDPAAASELVAGMPPSDQRRQLALQVAGAYAQRDATAALAWARDLSGNDPELGLAIVQGVAFNDPLRAIDLAESLDEPARSRGLLTAITAGGDNRPYAALGNRVLRLPEGLTRSTAVSSLLRSWGLSADAAQALDWAFSNANSVPPEAFEQLAYIVGRSDPATAAAYLDRVPDAARPGWLAAVTVSYAANDPQAALSLLERYRGHPGFDRAANALAPQLAQTDPPAAARLLGSAGERSTNGLGAEMQVAMQWAQRDPAAAADWAIDSPPMQRNALLNIVTGAWAQSDRDAVRRWALGMPSGEKRDAALAAAVRTYGAEPDSALLNAFSDDRSRQAAMMPVVMETAMTDRDAARRLLSTYINDPEMRAQGERIIETMPRGAISSTMRSFPTPAGASVSFATRGVPIGVAPPGVPIGVVPPSMRLGGPPPANVLFAPNGSLILPAQVPAENRPVVIGNQPSR